MPTSLLSWRKIWKHLTMQIEPGMGSYLVSKKGTVMLFCKPTDSRRAGFLFSILLSSPLVVNSLVVPSLSGKWPGALFSLVGVGAMMFALYHFAGPDDIQLDGSQRTYKRKFGWPWKPTTSCGMFDDIKGIRISPQNTVYIHLKETEAVRRGIAIGRYGTKAAAAALTEELKRE